jgi:hypothetical protein
LQAVDQLLRLGVQRPLVQQESRDRRLPADEDVLCHGQVRHQVEFLVNDADAELQRLPRCRGVQGPAVQPELPGVGGIDAGQQLHQRRLAGAVLTDQGQHLAAAQLQAHVRQRPDPREALAHPLGREQRGGRNGVSPRRHVDLQKSVSRV